MQEKLPFDWNRESNNYIMKMERMNAHEAQLATTRQGGCLELINHSLQGVDLGQYFEKMPLSDIEVIKLVRTGMTDYQLNDLLNIILHERVSTLVLSGNCLT